MYTLHNHTYLCKHATGTSKDMIEAAINNGFTTIGISDHIAYPITATDYRMEFSQRTKYLNELRDLKQKYLNQFDILIGFEAEYQTKFDGYLQELFILEKIDYLVLGQHYYDVSNPDIYYGGYMNEEILIQYVDQCIEGMQTGMFLVLAHPDLFMNYLTVFKDYCKRESTRLIKAAKKYNVYLEYNAGGIRNNSQINHGYPLKEFWKIVKEYDVEVIVSSDAHSPNQINDGAYILALEQAEELGLNIIDYPDFDNYKTRIKEYITSS